MKILFLFMMHSIVIIENTTVILLHD